jgi:hypothetical protein
MTLPAAKPAPGRPREVDPPPTLPPVDRPDALAPLDLL